MLSERIVEWTEQWKQEGLQQGLHSERRALLRLIRRRFGDTVADQSAPTLEGIAQPPVLEDLFENLLDCPDENTWLARLRAAVEKD
ncbi:MAG: transposase [Candidatus Competibacteraceae bacterium]